MCFSNIENIEVCIPDYLLDSIEHRMDNSFLRSETLSQLSLMLTVEKMSIVGFSFNPPNQVTKSVGIVLENIDTFEKCWFHCPLSHYKYWIGKEDS